MYRSAVTYAVMVVLAGCSASDDDRASVAGETSHVVHTSHGDIACTCDHADFVCPRATRGLEISPVTVDLSGKSPAEIVQIGYGSYVVNAMSDCASCHSSAAGFLAGGNPFAVDHAGHVVFSRNLTPDAATGLPLTLAQFIEALRTGRDFHPNETAMLVVMPWLFYRWGSTGDLEAIYAYLRAIPPVMNAVPPDVKAGLNLPPAIPFPGVFDVGDVTRPLPDTVSIAPNYARGLAIQPLAQPSSLGNPRRFARGSYLVNSFSLCVACHTQGAPGAPIGLEPSLHIATDHYMTGGNVFTVPPPLRPVLHQTRTMSANLTGAMLGFFHEPDVDYALFAALIHTQSHVDEQPPRPLGFPMPAAQFSNLVDYDLRSIFTYATHVPPNTAFDLPRQDYARWCASDADCNQGETCHLDPDPLVGNECVGKACSSDSDCDACQTCGSCNTCEAPTATSACLAGAF